MKIEGKKAKIGIFTIHRFGWKEHQHHHVDGNEIKSFSVMLDMP